MPRDKAVAIEGSAAKKKGNKGARRGGGHRGQGLVKKLTRQIARHLRLDSCLGLRGAASEGEDDPPEVGEGAPVSRLLDPTSPGGDEPPSYVLDEPPPAYERGADDEVVDGDTSEDEWDPGEFLEPFAAEFEDIWAPALRHTYHAYEPMVCCLSSDAEPGVAVYLEKVCNGRHLQFMIPLSWSVGALRVAVVNTGDGCGAMPRLFHGSRLLDDDGLLFSDKQFARRHSAGIALQLRYTPAAWSLSSPV